MLAVSVYLQVSEAHITSELKERESNWISIFSMFPHSPTPCSLAVGLPKDKAGDINLRAISIQVSLKAVDLARFPVGKVKMEMRMWGCPWDPSPLRHWKRQRSQQSRRKSRVLLSVSNIRNTQNDVRLILVIILLGILDDFVNFLLCPCLCCLNFLW